MTVGGRKRAHAALRDGMQLDPMTPNTVPFEWISLVVWHWHVVNCVRPWWLSICAMHPLASLGHI